jgi:photosystem II stability/assembly factor-like uncharacterized protein
MLSQMRLNFLQAFSLLLGIFGALLGLCLAAVAPRAQEREAPPAVTLDWRAQESGVLARLSAVFFIDRERGWVVGSNGTALVTENGGNTWRRASLLSRELLRDVVFLDRERGFALGEYSLFNRTGSLPKERSFLLASDDGGAHWITSRLARSKAEAEGRARAASDDDEPDRYQGEGLLRLRFVDERTGWACGEAGAIITTRDGGQTWRAQQAPARKLLYDLTAVSEKQAWIVGATGLVLRTVDGGEQWQEQASGTTQTLRAAHFIDAQRGWAVGVNGTIIATTTGGHRWRAQTSGVESDLHTVFFTSAREGWAAGERGTLLRTRDGGARWERVALKTRANLTRLFFIAPDCGWVVGHNGAIFKYQPGDPASRPALRNPGNGK